MSHKVTIPIGPYHSLQEEPEFYQLTVDGETVVDIDVRIGYVHRGIEKLAEAKSFDKIIFLVEQHMRHMLDQPPDGFSACHRRYRRYRGPGEGTVYKDYRPVKLERLPLATLLWLGLAGHFLGYNTVWMWAWKYRETVCRYI